jgi:hypothetical protein
MDTIVNKVSQSGLSEIDLEAFYDEASREIYDIKEQLFMGLMLKEKEFREFIKSNEWSKYAGKHVAIICSADAIVPTWAYMLVANKLSGVAKSFVFGDLNVLEFSLFKEKIDGINLDEYKDQRVVVKGCSKKPVPVSAYVYLTEKLTPIVKSIMYGEPCSTVPVYKRA